MHSSDWIKQQYFWTFDDCRTVWFYFCKTNEESEELDSWWVWDENCGFEEERNSLGGQEGAKPATLLLFESFGYRLQTVYKVHERFLIGLM